MQSQQTMGDLSTYFNKDEFLCKCGCGFGDVSTVLVQILDDVRREINAPVHIRSGCRCIEWNRKSNGKKHSAHLKGLAVDIECKGSRYRSNLLNAVVPRFERRGIGRSFIHVDISTSLPQNVTWLY